jgi:hypothetical protein
MRQKKLKVGYPTFTWITSTRSEFPLNAGMIVLNGAQSFHVGIVHKLRHTPCGKNIQTTCGIVR